MEPQATEWGRNDRDLLVELRTEMRGVREDLRKLTDGNDTRLKALETGKLDRTEANRLQSESLAVHSNFENRIRALEDDQKVFKAKISTWLAVGAALFAVLQIAVQFVFDYFLN